MPYEQSCEVTKDMLQRIKDFRDFRVARLDLVEVGGVALNYVARVFVGHEYTTNAQGGYQNEIFEVQPGFEGGFMETTLACMLAFQDNGQIQGFLKQHGRVPDPAKAVVQIPSYVKAQTLEANRLASEIAQAEVDVAFFTEKVDNWVLEPAWA